MEDDSIHITEQIPEDMPEWVVESMANGSFFKDCLQRISDLQDFAIWMTGCGYDFCQHSYFTEKRDALLK